MYFWVLNTHGLGSWGCSIKKPLLGALWLMDCLLSLLLPCQSLHPPSSQRRKSSCLSQPLSPTFFPSSVNWAPLCWIINDRTGKTSALLLPHPVCDHDSCRFLLHLMQRPGWCESLCLSTLVAQRKQEPRQQEWLDPDDTGPTPPSLPGSCQAEAHCLLTGLPAVPPLLPPPPPQTVMAHPPAWTLQTLPRPDQVPNLSLGIRGPEGSHSIYPSHYWGHRLPNGWSSRSTCFCLPWVSSPCNSHNQSASSCPLWPLPGWIVQISQWGAPGPQHLWLPDLAEPSGNIPPLPWAVGSARVEATSYLGPKLSTNQTLNNQAL